MNDNQEISDLVIWERQCRVRHLQKELKDCYFDDAVCVTSWSGGRVNVNEYLNGGKAPVNDPEYPIVSRCSTPVIHQNGDRAYAEVPSITFRWTNVNGEKAVLESHMRFIFCTEKRDGEWKIVFFGNVYESDTLTPEIQGTDLKIDCEEVKKLRHSYRYQAYVDEGVSQELPGIDRPDTVDALYKEVEDWMADGRKYDFVSRTFL